ncbi:MAG: hypothetical protein GQ574_20665 [Crocinitomix sp.]|nr:hypothetical protein [Crocinitomix sp.]
MSPDLVEATSKDGIIGDFGFMFPPEKPVSVLFSRSNMTIRIVNMQRNLAPITEVSTLLDAHFFGKLANYKDELLDAAIQFGVKANITKVGEKIALEIKVAEPFDKEAWLKLTCETGEFSKEGEHVFYHPAEKGSHKIALHAIGRKGRNHTIELTLNAE